jgi:hypothetical protein
MLDSDKPIPIRVKASDELAEFMEWRKKEASHNDIGYQRKPSGSENVSGMAE